MNARAPPASWAVRVHALREETQRRREHVVHPRLVIPVAPAAAAGQVDVIEDSPQGSKLMQEAS